jgi:HAD superfamily hydrolase (TIGR01509 family)
MARIRAVFLDAGGTLIHLDRGFILAALAEQGIAKDEAAFLIADQLAREHRAAAIRSGEVLDDASSWRVYAVRLLELLEATGDAAEGVTAAIRQRHRAGTLWTHVEPGTLETLAQLKDRGYTLGVVSNADGRVENFLQHVGITRYLDFVVDSGIVGVEKPNPRIFEIALERGNVSKDEVVHVGDVYEVDVLGARAAGIEPIMIITTGSAAPPDVRVIRSFTELPTHLNGLR